MKNKTIAKQILAMEIEMDNEINQSKSFLYKVSESYLKYTFYIAGIGAVCTLVVYCIQYMFDIFDKITPTYILYVKYVSFAIFIIGSILAYIMLLLFTSSSGLSHEEREKLIIEINSVKAEIAEFQSDNWHEAVKNVLAERFDRISSQQFLADERDNQIRNRRYYLETLEARLKS